LSWVELRHPETVLNASIRQDKRNAVRFGYLDLMCAISKSLTTAKLLNATNARSKYAVNSSQRHQTRWSTRHTILRCDELTGSRWRWLHCTQVCYASGWNDENFDAKSELMYFSIQLKSHFLTSNICYRETKKVQKRATKLVHECRQSTHRNAIRHEMKD